MRPRAHNLHFDKGLLCYQVMTFGLKNAGVTYQRLANTMFEEHIGKLMEMYVDDMLLKSVTLDAHITNLTTVLDTTIANGMMTCWSKA